MFITALILAAHFTTSAVAQVPRDTVTDVRDLPIVELKAAKASGSTVAIILSGDGGWADIDERVGESLQAHGVDVIGFDMRSYLHDGHRTPVVLGRDVSRIARRYMQLWHKQDVAIVGYSRGSDLAPFAANNLAPDIRPHLKLIAMLALLERASFTYHFSDLWRTTSNRNDLPILPQLEMLKGVPMLCVYGKEERESLCRTAPPGLLTVVARNGKHHFDGNYAALGDMVYQAVVRTSEGHPIGDLDKIQ